VELTDFKKIKKAKLAAAEQARPATSVKPSGSGSW
jgi:hypothetical protein